MYKMFYLFYTRYIYKLKTVSCILNGVSRLRKVDPPPPARQRKVSRIADSAYFIIFIIGLPLADFLSLRVGGGICYSIPIFKIQDSTAEAVEI